MTRRLHVLGVPHTIANEDFSVCAFTTKILLFPDVIQPFGWEVFEYSNEGSISSAHKHVPVIDQETFRRLSKRKSREDTFDADVQNSALQNEFQTRLLNELSGKVLPADIICHVWGPNIEVYNAFPRCHHVELSVGYTASPGLPFRVYETSAWMHWHYGKAAQEDGSNYKWVIPSAFDVDRWQFCATPGDHVVYMGRVTQRKGIDTIVEIASRLSDRSFYIYGPGDVSPWIQRTTPNLFFRSPVFGPERSEAVRSASCMIMPTVFIEPFGFSGIEAQLCGVPLIGASYGAFQETIVEGVTGYKCYTLEDWVQAIRLSGQLNRWQISQIARAKYSKSAIGKLYNQVFLQLRDLSAAGWYTKSSHRF